MQCTFVRNSAYNGGGVYSRTSVAPRIENSIIAFSTNGEAVLSEAREPEILCSDFYGNASGDWTGPIADQYGVNGNISADPLFCGPDFGDFSLDCASPCATDSECGQIGAWPVGCGPTPALASGWGKIKVLFRSRTR